MQKDYKGTAQELQKDHYKVITIGSEKDYKASQTDDKRITKEGQKRVQKEEKKTE